MSANFQYNNHQEKMQGENAKGNVFLVAIPLVTLSLQELLPLLGRCRKKSQAAPTISVSIEMPVKSLANVERNLPKERLLRASFYVNNVGGSAYFFCDLKPYPCC
jgi:hypothetical protein